MPALEVPDKGSNPLSRDERFLQKLNKIIESNLGNDQFGVDYLADAMDMSRIQLYRRLHRLKRKNISQYIREYRLEKAMELLTKNVASVSEIAYQVGFGSPAYFNKCFHDYYGYPPGELLKNPQLQNEILKARIEKDKKGKYINPILWPNKYLIFVLIVLIIVIAAIVYIGKLYRSVPTETSAIDNSIAVLPFHNDSPDLNNEHLCNGIMDDILTHLEKISDLKVKSRQSVEKYRDSEKDPITIGRELNVAYILEGSFRRVEDKIRVTVQLIEASTGNHDWANTYDGAFSAEIFEFQSNVAIEVATAMNAIITQAEQKQIETKPTDSIEAYAFAKRGGEFHRAYWRDEDTLNLYSALSLFNKALKIDPNLHDAIAGKGAIYTIIAGQFRRGRMSYPIIGFDSAIYYYKRAIELDPQHPFVYTSLGEIYFRMRNDDLAIKYFEKAIQLKPANDWAYLQLGEVYLRKKDFEKGLPYIYKSISVCKDNFPEIYLNVGIDFLYHIDCYEKAEEYMKKALELQIGCSGITHYIRFLRYAGKYEKAFYFLDSIQNMFDCERRYKNHLFYIHTALKNFEQAKEYSSFAPDRWAFLYKAHVDKELGNINYRQDLDSLNNFLMNPYSYGKFPPNLVLQLAQIHAILDEKETALKFLLEYEKLCSESEDIIHAYLEVHPIFEDLQSNPEFKAIFERARDKRKAMCELITDFEKELNY